MNKVKYLVVAGDSNSFGSESIVDGDMNGKDNIKSAYGAFLAKELGVPESNYINCSYPGASNLYIIVRLLEVLDYLNSKNINSEDILLIIGWSEPTRTTIQTPEKNHLQISLFLYNLFFKVKMTDLFSKKNSTIKDVPSLSKFERSSYQKVMNKIKIYPYIESFIKGLGIYFLNTDLILIQDLMMRKGMIDIIENKKIKYFSFPSLRDIYFESYFYIVDTINSKNNIFTYEKNKFLLGSKYKVKFCLYGKFEKYGKSSIGGHLKIEAHKHIASFIYNELINRKIL
jgi:hypothetical protein